MYLVHLALRPPPGAPLPPALPALVQHLAHPEERLEHVVSHAQARPHPLLGLFLRSDSLAEAERAARAIGLRATTHVAALRGWTVLRAEVPLIAPLLDPAGVPGEARDGSGQGRIRPAGRTSGPWGGTED